MLDAAAYEALYSKRADFTIPFTAWEGVEAGLRGIKLRYFQFADYGFPEFYQVVLACDRQWLEKDPEAARRFVAATVKGFQFAADQPDEAAAILVAENPGVFDANKELPQASQRFLAEGGYLVDASGTLRDADARALDRVLGVPVRAGPARRWRRQAADRAARLRAPVHERLPAVNQGLGANRDGTRGRGARSPVRAARRARRAPARGLGGVRPDVGSQPVRPAGAEPGPRLALGLPRARGPSRDPDDPRDRRRLRDLDHGRHHGRRRARPFDLGAACRRAAPRRARRPCRSWRSRR